MALRPLDAVLTLHTMRFADELVDPDGLDIASPSRQPAKREIEMAQSLVDSPHEDFRADAFTDGYRQRVLDLIAAKGRGEEPDLPTPDAASDDLDLSAALRPAWSGKAKGLTDGPLTVDRLAQLRAGQRPDKAVTAVRDLDFHFRQLHKSDGAPIEVQRVCEQEGCEVPYDETHGTTSTTAIR